MTLTEEKDGEQRRKSEASGSKGGPSTGRKKRAAVPEVGQALRTVYQKAVDEDIPPEMLDLLGKLG